MQIQDSKHKYVWRVSACFAVAFCAFSACAQGTFKNLNFESANVSGDTPASMIPISSGFPGWSATESGSSLTQVWYDNVALGSAMLAINDKNLGGGSGPQPLQGNYSAYIAGGEGNAITLEQTGFVPTGTKSLTVDIQTPGLNLQVTLGGQTISMLPLQVHQHIRCTEVIYLHSPD